MHICRYAYTHTRIFKAECTYAYTQLHIYICIYTRWIFKYADTKPIFKYADTTICRCAILHIYRYAYMHIRIHKYADMQSSMHICIYAYTNMQICKTVCTHACTHLNIYMHIYNAQMQVCIYTTFIQICRWANMQMCSPMWTYSHKQICKYADIHSNMQIHNYATMQPWITEVRSVRSQYGRPATQKKADSWIVEIQGVWVQQAQSWLGRIGFQGSVIRWWKVK